MKYWRIGDKTYFNSEMKRVLKKYPFVWGGGVCGKHNDGKDWHGSVLYPEYIKDVKIGDILVAGGVLNIDYIGKIISKPTFIPNEENYWPPSCYQSYDIEEETEQKVIDELWKLGLYDIVCIKAQWILEEALRFPHKQTIGGFQQITNDENIHYISDCISRLDGV
jgi:hypothetical protein